MQQREAENELARRSRQQELAEREARHQRFEQQRIAKERAVEARQRQEDALQQLQLPGAPAVLIEILRELLSVTAAQHAMFSQFLEARRGDMDLLLQLQRGLQALLQQQHTDNLRALSQLTDLMRDMMVRGGPVGGPGGGGPGGGGETPGWVTPGWVTPGAATPKASSAPPGTSSAPPTPSGRSSRVATVLRCMSCHKCLIRKDNPRSRLMCLKPPNVKPAQQEKPWPEVQKAADRKREHEKKTAKDKKEKKEKKRRIANARGFESIQDPDRKDNPDKDGGAPKALRSRVVDGKLIFSA